MMTLDGYRICAIDKNEAPDVQALFEADPGFFELTQGAPPGPGEVQSMITALPAGKGYVDKFNYCVYQASGESSGVLAAVIDLVRDYPDAGTWFLGLLFVAPHMRSKGLGLHLLAAITAHIQREGGSALRLAVMRENTRARSFYRRAGFQLIEERRQAQPLRGLVHVLELPF